MKPEAQPLPRQDSRQAKAARWVRLQPEGSMAPASLHNGLNCHVPGCSQGWSHPNKDERRFTVGSVAGLIGFGAIRSGHGGRVCR